MAASPLLPRHRTPCCTYRKSDSSNGGDLNEPNKKKKNEAHKKLKKKRKCPQNVAQPLHVTHTHIDSLYISMCVCEAHLNKRKYIFCPAACPFGSFEAGIGFAAASASVVFFFFFFYLLGFSFFSADI